MDYLNLLFRWLHIVPAAAMLGGIIFVRFCLLNPHRDQNVHFSPFEADDGLRRRWMKLVSVSTLCLLASGLYNGLHKILAYQLNPDYHGLFGAKLLLGLAVFYLAALLAGRSERAKRLRQRETQWLNWLLILSLLVVLIGGYMKVSSADAVRKSRDPSPPVSKWDAEGDTTPHATRSSL
jgi:putative copper export protein